MKAINRNNYEEFFLLYVDDELNTAEKIAVENFVEQNADLAAELNALLNTKFSVDAIGFNDKESLLKTEGDCINETNHEEYFLLYIDNELSAAKREEVERYVLQHPKLQDEFVTLKKAVLQAEAMSYSDKESLYRTEKRRTVYLKPWRLAAAAIFIGVCAVGFWLTQKSNSVKQPVAVNNIKTIKPTQNNIVVTPADSTQQIHLSPQMQNETNVAQQSSLSTKKENKHSEEITVTKKKKADHINNNNTQQIEKYYNEPVIAQQRINESITEKQQKEPPVVKIIEEDAPQHITQKQNDVAALQTNNNTEQQNNYKAYNVAYKEINTNDDDRSLKVGMLDLNKDKVKTLFKKAGRLFGNKSNDLANKDGKLQVANFEIKTKQQ